MNCLKCANAEAAKNGEMQGKQRYKCKDCGCNYTQSSRYCIDRETRIRCLRLYLEGVGFRGIARLRGISHVIVQRWVKLLGDNIERLRPQTGEIKPVSVMELGEMWRFVQKKSNQCWVRLAYERDG